MRLRSSSTTGDGLLSRLSPEARRRLRAFKSRRVGVVGLGREGADLVRFLTRWGAEIVASDRAAAAALGPSLAALDGIPVTYRLGEQTGRDLQDCSEVFVSPGVPPESPVVADTAAAGIPISSATRLFFELCPGPIVGITGSSGKTTTTSLVGAILKQADIPSLVGGNIGTPMLERLEDITADTWSVLELSSFQLSDVTQSPQVAAVLNITPNHLDRHPDMGDYIRAKHNIIRYQHPEDTAVLNADDPIVAPLSCASRKLHFSLTQPTNGGWLDGDVLMLATSDGVSVRLLVRSELQLRGIHNVANVLAAATIAGAVGCSPAATAAAAHAFQPVPHRLEVVATIDGVTYVNDSIATSPERSIAGLRSIDEPIVLIAGGRDKHLPLEDWAEVIAQRVRAVVLVGEMAPLIRSALEGPARGMPVVTAGTFAETTALAHSLAEPGDVVLLAPGGTSFDEFRDYQARGEAFRASVLALRKGENP